MRAGARQLGNIFRGIVLAPSRAQRRISHRASAGWHDQQAAVMMCRSARTIALEGPASWVPAASIMLPA